MDSLNHIIVYAGSNPQYAGFYISYLESYIPKSHITFFRDAFIWSYSRVCGTTLALLIYADDSALSSLRLAIDTGDGYDIMQIIRHGFCRRQNRLISGGFLIMQKGISMMYKGRCGIECIILTITITLSWIHTLSATYMANIWNCMRITGDRSSAFAQCGKPQTSFTSLFGDF